MFSNRHELQGFRSADVGVRRAAIRLTRNRRYEMPRTRGVRRRFRPGSSPEALEGRCLLAAAWAGYAGNAQHTADTSTAAQSLQAIRWQTPVDTDPQYSGNDLLIHYGSPLITAANTVIVPVKTQAAGGFVLNAFVGSDGTPLWTEPTDYALPTPHDWTPSFSPTLATIPGTTPVTRLYFQAADGTVEYINNPDSPAMNPDNTPVTVRVAFYGTANYQADLTSGQANIEIDTPLTADAAGNIYFGYQVSGANAANLTNGGVAKIAPDGTATYMPIASVAQNFSYGGTTYVVNRLPLNAAPAISNDGSTLYIAASTSTQDAALPDSHFGELIELNTANLSRVISVELVDPAGTANAGAPSVLTGDSTASPTIGPDGDVFYGVLEHTFASNDDRGWLLHFTSSLSATAPGGGPEPDGFFGWDDTVSIVPASLVPSYQGTSTYLLMTKYNNYANFTGGSGINQVAVLDPDTPDPAYQPAMTMMNAVLTIDGVTPDPEFDQTHPGAVREWCINTAVVDINPATHSIYVNSEDGTLYRWDLDSPGAFTQQVVLTAGLGEAYTPTSIGPDGTVYAISNGELFAVGSPSAVPTVTQVVVNDGTTRQRSFIGSVTVSFTDPSIVTTLLAHPSWVNVEQFGLDGTTVVRASVSNMIAQAVAGNPLALAINFGPGGVGGPGTQDSNSGDGIYQVNFEYDGTALDTNSGTTFDPTPQTIRFFRLLGDVNGDGTVNTTDVNLVTNALGLAFNPNDDTDGDGTISSHDRNNVLLARNRSVTGSFTY